MKFQKVVVAGGGVLGSQIAMQTAFHGFDVTMWLRSEDSVGRTKPKMERLHQIYLDTLESLRFPYVPKRTSILFKGFDTGND